MNFKDKKVCLPSNLTVSRELSTALMASRGNAEKTFDERSSALRLEASGLKTSEAITSRRLPLRSNLTRLDKCLKD